MKMMIRNPQLLITTLLLLASPFTSGEDVSDGNDCQTVTTVEDFDIVQYASAPWYSHQQAVNSYSPLDQNYCTTAQYTVLDDETFWGYTIGVSNTAQYENGIAVGGDLCAYQTDPDETPSKLAVAPCFLPTFFSGPYWVVAYNETEGYALISGGQPTVPSGNGDGLCRTGTGINDSGLWIFSRSQERDENLITTVRDIAVAAGFDVSVLNDVDHTSCDACDDLEGTFEVGWWRKKDRDCDWVGEKSSFRCIVHGDKCPDTCELC